MTARSRKHSRPQPHRPRTAGREAVRRSPDTVDGNHPAHRSAADKLFRRKRAQSNSHPTTHRTPADASTRSKRGADKLFRRKQPLVRDFNFGRQTAAVFDDMLARSVPFYAEVQRMMGEVAADFAQEDTAIYDLGCSTGQTFQALDPIIPKHVRFVGVDNSHDMLAKAKHTMKQQRIEREIDWAYADLNGALEISDASVVIMNLTLQFVRPLNRQKLIATVFRGLRPNGCLIVVEKVLSRYSMLNRLFIKYYYGFKERNGYSKMEISQKREALENVLIPYRVEENLELLTDAGFKECEVFFK